MVHGLLQHSSFSLDASGVAGFFGGDEAVSAMATVHVYEGRKWRGWYNSPGSYEIAKRYGQLANSRFWDGLFPGVNLEPAALFGLDGKLGPKYVAARSGTIIKQTGHCAHLFMRSCRDLTPQTIEGRESFPMTVTISDLKEVPEPRTHPRLLRTYSGLLAAIPISASFATSAMCAYYRDWICFAMIMLGTVSSGLSCAVIGAGELTFTRPRAADGAPDGDGVLVSEKDIVVLRGPEAAVNTVTHGRFSLHYAGEPEYRAIGLSSMLLTAQFLLQLLLIPQGSLFGQIMFLASLAVSWAYNSYLSSLKKEQVQIDILAGEVLKMPAVRRFALGTRTAMAVFVLLVLRPTRLEKQLGDMLPNDTDVWVRWKETIVRRMESDKALTFDSANWDVEGMSSDEKLLLQTLYSDAQAAYNGYMQYVASEPSSRASGMSKF